jgi:hypothetical protein
MSSIAEAIALAAPTFTGQLLQPTDHAYDERHRVHNGLIDKRPVVYAGDRKQQVVRRTCLFEMP